MSKLAHRMVKQARYDRYYMDLAIRAAEMSYDSHTKVGCIIVNDGVIISDGWNGTPSCFPNECKDSEGVTLPWVIHAEANAIYKLAKTGGCAKGATLYTTFAPCNTCATAILQAGITRVIYNSVIEKYDGRYLLDSIASQI